MKLSSLIGAAPSVLTAIIELATALYNDSNYTTTIQNQINITSDKANT